MSWAFSDKADDYNLDENIHEDAKTRKRRIQTELSRALAVLGVKHSTFYSMLSAGRHSQVKEMLKVALQERSDNVINFDIEKHEEEFNIHLEIADLTTIHEAYQYLVRK